MCELSKLWLCVCVCVQNGMGLDEGGRGVTSIQTLVQSFKIAERSSPGFCDDLVQRTIDHLYEHCS